ncbi:MAG: DUF1992 domain-containing protein [Nocardioidaceae bacterium]
MTEPPRFSEGWVDKQIREAYERGEFDDLPGAGKPLSLRNLDDPDWFAKQIKEREQLDGMLPTPMALRKERRELPARIDELADEARVREVLRDFNTRVRDALLRDAHVVVGGVNVEECVAAWRARRLSS